ncbi:TPA: hypothetical protein DIU22_04545 [Candidatus Woesebacteria bacterium]|nr:hypothetical protein [Candidatus Woesebacteria bacterium]
MGSKIGVEVGVIVGLAVSVGFGVGVTVGIGTGVVDKTSRSCMSSTSNTLFFESYDPTASILFPTSEIKLKPTGISKVTASVEVVMR